MLIALCFGKAETIDKGTSLHTFTNLKQQKFKNLINVVGAQLISSVA